MYRFSLRKKIILATISVGTMMGLVFGFFIFFYLRDALVDQKIHEINQLNIEQGHETTQIFSKYQLFTKMLGTRTRVKEYLLDRSEIRREELDNIFLEYAQEDPRYLAIYLLDEKGHGLISTDPRFVGQDYSFRDYYKQAVQGNAWTEILLGKTSNQFGYYFSYPVNNKQDEVIGVLVVKVGTEEVDQSIVSSEISKNSKIMLVDQYGVIVYSNYPDRFLKSLGTLSPAENLDLEISNKFLWYKIESLQYDVVQNLLHSNIQSQTIKFNDKEDGDQEIIGVVKLENFPFYLVTETSLDQIERTIFSTIMFIVLVTFLLIILMVFLMYRLISIFISPLEKLKVFAGAMSVGDFSKKIEIKNQDEFGELATAFNKMAKDLTDLYKNLDKKVKAKTSEIEVKNKDLDEQKLALLNVLEDAENEKEKVRLLATDLEKFKLAVANASDHIIITDPDANILYANKAVEKITGFKSQEIVGKKAGSKDLWGGQMGQDFYKEMWHVIKVEKNTFSGIVKNKRKNGEEYESAVSISPILDSQGNVQFFVGIERDVTQERQIDRAKSEFVSLASHQLRTPLSAINWYAEMLLAGDAGKITAEQTDYIKEIYQGNQRMVDLVNALLNVSRIELGKLAVEPAPTKLLELADSVIAELTPSIKLKKLKLIKEYDKKIPVINLDPKLMRIVFQNYLSNAVKYTPDKGTVNLKISQDKKQVTIAVSDTGYGIPEAQKDKIFQKLFRADNVRAKETEGTGLGLYIIKSVIEQFGGKVWFESKENKGSTFYATVPLKGVARREGSKGLENTK